MRELPSGTAVREELGERFREAWTAGAKLDLEAAAELALQALD